MATVAAVAAEAASDEPSTTRASGPAGSGRGVGDDRIVGCAYCIPATTTIAANYVADAAAAGRAAAYCTGQGNCDVAAPADADTAVAAVAADRSAADRSATNSACATCYSKRREGGAAANADAVTTNTALATYGGSGAASTAGTAGKRSDEAATIASTGAIATVATIATDGRRRRHQRRPRRPRTRR